MRNRYRGVYACNANDGRVFNASVFFGCPFSNVSNLDSVFNYAFSMETMSVFDLP